MCSPFKSFRDTAGQAEVDAVLLAVLVHASPAVLYSCKVSEDYGTILVTDNVAQVLGYAPADFISDPSFWAVRIHPEDSTRVFEEMSQLFREGQQVIEYRFRRANGTYTWLRDQMSLECDQDGKPVRILGCWTEVSGKEGAAFISEVVSESANTRTTTTATSGGRYANQT
jgi:PAS domain-containing protein